MMNMMKDILQYVPYALFLAAVFSLLLLSVAYTMRYFRQAGRNAAK